MPIDVEDVVLSVPKLGVKTREIVPEKSICGFTSIIQLNRGNTV